MHAVSLQRMRRRQGPVVGVEVDAAGGGRLWVSRLGVGSCTVFICSGVSSRPGEGGWVGGGCSLLTRHEVK